MERSRIHLRQLLYFIKIVEAGSFSRAASLVHVAQPALSQQIAELEETLGVSLLNRSTRGARPTAAGELLYAEALDIVRRIDHLPELVRTRDDDVKGLVRVGLSSVLAATLADAIVHACKVALPNVMLHLVNDTSEAVVRRVHERSLDVAMIFDSEQTTGLASKALFQQRVFIIMRGTTPTAQDGIALDELRTMPLVLPSRSHPDIARTFDPLFDEAEATPRVMVENDFSAILSAVQAGLGNAVLAIGDLSHVKGGAELKAVPLEPPLYLSASLITSHDPSSPSAADAAARVVSNLAMRYLAEGRIVGAMPVAS